jgi:hypothetical protein
MNPGQRVQGFTTKINLQSNQSVKQTIHKQTQMSLQKIRLSIVRSIHVKNVNRFVGILSPELRTLRTLLFSTTYLRMLFTTRYLKLKLLILTLYYCTKLKSF